MSLKEYFQKEKPLRHLAIIMDGNSRWSAKIGSDAAEGYAKGADALHRTIEYAIEYCLPMLTVYAFSTENWKRSQEEVSSIMELFKTLLLSKERFFLDHGVRFRVIGSQIAEGYMDVVNSMKRLEEITRSNDKLMLTVAFNYGGKQEIVEAAQQISRAVFSHELKPEEITLELFEKYLYTADMPAVDLLIRTSGEYRISNFLLWQAAYAELVFTKTLWPDFERDDFEKAMEEFLKRHRRFGVTHSS